MPKYIVTYDDLIEKRELYFKGKLFVNYRTFDAWGLRVREGLDFHLQIKHQFPKINEKALEHAEEIDWGREENILIALNSLGEYEKGDEQ